MKGVWFDNIHSYEDLNLILSKADIPPAEPKTNFVDLPGGNGSVDLTEAQGEVKYKDRDSKLTFTVFSTDDFEEKKKEISNLLNGKRCKVILDKDPNYYWAGRLSIDNYASNKNVHTIVIGGKFAPYKLKKDITTIKVSAGDNVAVILQNGRKSVVPTITALAEATIEFNGGTYTVGTGTQKVLNIKLIEGENLLKVTSADTVTFEYQEGDL